MKLFSTIVICLLVGTACGQPRDDGTISVVAGSFVVADVVRGIGGDRVSVTDLTPAGAEPHDIELTSDDLDMVIDADLVVFIGNDFQPSLEEASDRSDGSVLAVEDGNDDPHIWLDPVAWGVAVARIGDALEDADPQGAPSYRRNRVKLQDEISSVHEAYNDGLKDCDRDLLVTAHAAFGRMTDRYGLRQEAISGITPEAEPDPRRLAELADLVKREDVTTVFTEELVSPEISEALAKEADVTVAVLDTIESRAAGGWAVAMRKNLNALRGALGCR